MAESLSTYVSFADSNKKLNSYSISLHLPSKQRLLAFIYDLNLTVHDPWRHRYLTPTHKYAAAGLFALALHHTQIHQKRPADSHVSLDEEQIAKTIGIGKNVSVSDEPHLWIHENSGLLLPVFRLLGVDDHAWDGLKETAGSSLQVRHHVGAFLTMLSEENEKAYSERTGC